MVKTHSIHHQTRIELSPNRSASWKQVKLLIAGIGTFVMLIAIAWSFVGAWLILPFAGFEVGLLALLMYRVSMHCHSKQIIIITPKSVTFECGIKQPFFHWQFTRTSTHISIVEAKTDYDRPQMVLTDEKISIPLGEFLNQQDCKIARQTFKDAGLIEIRDTWWRSGY